MAERHRCKDRLPHLDHDWTNGNSAGSDNLRRARHLKKYCVLFAKTYWCPGIESTEEKQ